MNGCTGIYIYDEFTKTAVPFATHHLSLQFAFESDVLCWLCELKICENCVLVHIAMQAWTVTIMNVMCTPIACHVTVVMCQV